MLIKKLYLILAILLSIFILNAQENATDGNQQADGKLLNLGEEGQGFEDFLVNFDETGKNDKESSLFHNENWELSLNSSANFIANNKLTFSKNVVDKSGNNHMGIRVNYPDFPVNSYATLTPPLPFSFNAAGANNINGIVKNVKEIRKVIVRIAGRYFPHKLWLDLQDIEGKEVTYNLGSLYFYGWKDKEWINKRILTDYRDEPDFQIPSTYPRILPSVKLNSISFFRDGEDQASDFITYISWIKVVYNKAFDSKSIINDRDAPDYIEDEDVWKIQAERANSVDNNYDDLFEGFKFKRAIERARRNIPDSFLQEGNNNQNNQNQDNQ